jgi:hypothetical protein
MPALSSWPSIRYFDHETDESQQCLMELEFMERVDWYELYRHRKDGSLWRIEVLDKYQQSYLTRIDNSSNWSSFDASALQKSLLLESRGGLLSDVCIEKDCIDRCLKGSVFCLNHSFQRGIRK